MLLLASAANALEFLGSHCGFPQVNDEPAPWPVPFSKGSDEFPRIVQYLCCGNLKKQEGGFKQAPTPPPCREVWGARQLLLAPLACSGHNPGYEHQLAEDDDQLPHIKNLTWYGTIGNHDYNGADIEAEFIYNKFGWKMDGFMYYHNHRAMSGDSVTFVHIDTNYLFYGPNGEFSKPRMKPYFQHYNFSKDQ